MGIDTKNPKPTPPSVNAPAPGQKTILEALVDRMPEEPVPFPTKPPEHHILHQRLGQDNHSTIGIYLSAVDWLPGIALGEVLCFVLEDIFRPNKVEGETRFPAGVVTLHRVRQSGILNKMRKWRPDLPWIVGIGGVPNYRLLRIHTGATHHHTDGCHIVGGGMIDAWKLTEDEAMVARSRDTYSTLHDRVFVPLFEEVEQPKMWVRDESFLQAPR